MWDFFMNLFIAIYFKVDECGKGIHWDGHKIMAVYFGVFSVIEYLIVLFHYKMIGQKINWWLHFFCAFQLFFGLLAKLDLYSDINMVGEIYKWSDGSLGIRSLLLISIGLLIASEAFQIYRFLWMIIGYQHQSTYNPVYCHTACLAYWANFKALGSFVDKMSINYFGFLKSDRLTGVKAIWFMKLVWEDVIQAMVQTYFFFFRAKFITHDANNLKIFYTVVTSLSLSFIWAWSSAYIWFYSDVTSPLLREDSKVIDERLDSWNEESFLFVDGGIDLPIPELS